MSVVRRLTTSERVPPTTSKMIDRINLEAELTKWNKRLFFKPYEPRIYIYRGMTYFKLGRIEESIKDFNKSEELNPQLTPYLWQRGLAYYYAEKYAQGARQFEVDLSVNSQDVEETLWHYLCISQLENAREAKDSILKVKKDPRSIMGFIYQLYAGNLSANDLLKIASNRGIRDIFYVNLYVGLYYEAEREPEKSSFHINKAVASQLQDYMWYLACVHQQIRLGIK